VLYKKIQADMLVVPVGSTQGVGVIMGYKIPSFMVKMIKSKDFMVGEVPKLIAGTA
jgi:apoptosis-inducing factor 2